MFVNLNESIKGKTVIEVTIVEIRKNYRARFIAFSSSKSFAVFLGLVRILKAN